MTRTEEREEARSENNREIGSVSGFLEHSDSSSESFKGRRPFSPPCVIVARVTIDIAKTLSDRSGKATAIELDFTARFSYSEIYETFLGKLEEPLAPSGDRGRGKIAAKFLRRQTVLSVRRRLFSRNWFFHPCCHFVRQTTITWKSNVNNYLRVPLWLYVFISYNAPPSEWWLDDAHSHRRAHSQANIVHWILG